MVLITRKRKRGVWYRGVFSKVLHILMTIVLLDFKKFLRCASWPVTHEKCSCACPACRKSWQVAAPAGAASLEPFQARAVLHKQEPLGKWSQGKSRARSRYKPAPGKSPREPGHEWCLGGARAAGKNLGKMAQRSPDKGLCSMLRRTRSNPRGPPLGPTLGV